MRNAFTPALGSVTHVAYDGVAPTTLRFTANLNRSEYYDLKRAGGIVQVWTNIPVQGKAKGEWGPISFNEASTSRRTEDALINDDGLPELSLVSVQEELEEEELRLSSGKTLSVSVQLEGDFTLHHYSFTYRVLYPSGGIWWLGDYGRNGVFVLESVAADRLGDINLEPGWAKTSGWVRDVSSEVTIGKLSSADKYKIWAIGKDGAPDASLQQAALLLLLPRPSHDTSVIPLVSTLLVASGETVLSLRPDGSLVAIGKGSVYAQAPADYNLERVLSLHSSLEFQVLSASADHNHGCVTHFVRKDTNAHPTYALAFPSSSSSSSSFSVDLDTSAFSNPDLAVYSSASHQARRLSSSPKLRVAANAIGGSFVVAPCYPITPSTHVVLTSSHVPSNPPVEMLTPPPSPLMRSSEPRPAETLPLPVKGIVIETPTPGESVQEFVPPSGDVSSAPEAEDPPLQEVPSTRSELVSAAKVWRERGIVSFVEHLTKTFMVLIIAIIFQRSGVSQHHKQLKPQPEEKVEKVEVQPPFPSQHSVAEGAPSTDDVETRSEAGSESTVFDGPAADPALREVDAAPAPAPEAIPILIKSHGKVAPAAYFDVPQGPAHLVLFTLSSKHVTIELDGMSVHPPFNEIGDGVYETLIKAVGPENQTTLKMKVGLRDGL